MSSRTDKGRSVANYLRTRTGIPSVRWVPSDGITVERPYSFALVSDRSLWRFSEAMRALPTTGLPMVVRYDAHIESVDDAWVAMRLAAAAPLLTLHYEQITQHTEGRN